MRVWVVIFCGMGLVGCVGVPGPEVRVTQVRQVEASDLGARFEVSLELDNPGESPLPLPEASYRFEVDGVGDYAYLSLPARVVPPGGRQSLTLPAAIATDGRSLAERPWSISGRLQYRPESPLRSFLTETGVPLPVVFFDARGRLP